MREIAAVRDTARGGEVGFVATCEIVNTAEAWRINGVRIEPAPEAGA